VCQQFDVGNQSPSKPLPANFEGTSRRAVGVEIPRDDRTFLWFVSFPLMDRHWRGRYTKEDRDISKCDFSRYTKAILGIPSEHRSTCFINVFSTWLTLSRTDSLYLHYVNWKKRLTEYGIVFLIGCNSQGCVNLFAILIYDFDRLTQLKLLQLKMLCHILPNCCTSIFFQCRF